MSEIQVIGFWPHNGAALRIDGIDISTIGLEDLRNRIVRKASFSQHWHLCSFSRPLSARTSLSFRVQYGKRIVAPVIITPHALVIGATLIRSENILIKRAGMFWKDVT